MDKVQGNYDIIYDVKFVYRNEETQTLSVPMGHGNYAYELRFSQDGVRIEYPDCLMQPIENVDSVYIQVLRKCKRMPHHDDGGRADG